MDKNKCIQWTKICKQPLRIIQKIEFKKISMCLQKQVYGKAVFKKKFLKYRQNPKKYLLRISFFSKVPRSLQLD